MSEHAANPPLLAGQRCNHRNHRARERGRRPRPLAAAAQAPPGAGSAGAGPRRRRPSRPRFPPVDVTDLLVEEVSIDGMCGVY